MAVPSVSGLKDSRGVPRGLRADLRPVQRDGPLLGGTVIFFDASLFGDILKLKPIFISLTICFSSCFAYFSLCLTLTPSRLER